MVMCPRVSERGFHLDLLWGPLVQVHRLDPGDVDPKVAVDPSTADAHEHAQVPGRPPRTWADGEKGRKKEEERKI